MSKRQYSKLTEEQKNEIESLNKDGKSAVEICAVLSEKYKTTIPPGKIYYTLKQSGKDVQKKGKNKKKDLEVNNTVAEIIELFMRTERANEAIFNYLRTKLIVNLWEKHKVMKKEKITIIPEDELTPEQEIAATNYYKALV